MKAARFFPAHNAALNHLPSWENLTPLDVAIRSNTTDLVDWLHAQGAKTYKESTKSKPG